MYIVLDPGQGESTKGGFNEGSYAAAALAVAWARTRDRDHGGGGRRRRGRRGGSARPPRGARDRRRAPDAHLRRRRQREPAAEPDEQLRGRGAVGREAGRQLAVCALEGVGPGNRAR